MIVLCPQSCASPLANVPISARPRVFQWGTIVNGLRYRSNWFRVCTESCSAHRVTARGRSITRPGV